jgi:phage terminase small subunit
MTDISDLIEPLAVAGELVPAEPGALVDPALELFAQQVALHGNHAEAARTAGLDENNSGRTAKRAVVAARIAVLRKQERERMAVDVAELEHGIDLIIQQDIADIVDPLTGEMLPIQKLPLRIRRAISGLEATVTIDPVTQERVYRFKYTFERRAAAQRLKAELKGLRQQLDITSNGQTIQAVDPLSLPRLDEELRKRLLAPQPAPEPEQSGIDDLV